MVTPAVSVPDLHCLNNKNCLRFPHFSSNLKKYLYELFNFKQHFVLLPKERM